MVHQHIPEEKLVDYILGQLSSKEHFEINAHLSICSKCRNEQTSWEKYLNVDTKSVPSPHLKQKLFTEIDMKKKRVSVKWLYVAVSLCVVILLFNFFQTSKQKIVSNHEPVVYLTPENHKLLGFQTTNPNYIKFLSHSSDAINEDDIWSMDTQEFNNLYLNSLSTQSAYDQSRIILLEYDEMGRMLFVIDDSICNYDLKSKQVYCIQMKMNSQMIQPVQNRDIYYKTP